MIEGGSIASLNIDCSIRPGVVQVGSSHRSFVIFAGRKAEARLTGSSVSVGPVPGKGNSTAAAPMRLPRSIGFSVSAGSLVTVVTRGSAGLALGSHFSDNCRVLQRA